MKQSPVAWVGVMVGILASAVLDSPQAEASLPRAEGDAAERQKAALTAPPPPPAAPTTAEARHVHAPPQPHEIREIAIKELGNFVYAPEIGATIPEDVQRLSGLTVRLRGYMMPLNQAQRITRFALVPSLTSCCFGQPPTMQHTVMVECMPGLAVDYCPGEVMVQGELTVKEIKQDRYVVGLFHVTAQSVGVLPPQ